MAASTVVAASAGGAGAGRCCGPVTGWPMRRSRGGAGWTRTRCGGGGPVRRDGRRPGSGVIAKGRGRKSWLPAGTVEEVVRLTRKERPADGSTHWTTRTLAARVGIGKDAVARIWADHELKPWQVETFKVSNDPQFEEKLVDVVGLYLNPPERAVVFSFDEKTQCQALDRTQPSLPMKPGRAGTMTHDYKRNGTIDLFAAMNVATGEVLDRPAHGHTGADVLPFFKHDRPHVPRGLEVHVCWTTCPRTHKPRRSRNGSPTTTAPLAPALHADLQLLAEPGRALVQGADRPTPAPRHLHQRRRPHRRDHAPGPNTGTTTPNPSSGQATAEDIIAKVRRGRTTLHQSQNSDGPPVRLCL